MDFVIAGGAAVTAGFITNPLEVLKTRLQLQGELKAKGQHPVHYRNVIHAAYQVAKNDGFLSLQKGLAPALWVQLIMNGIRLGTFRFAETRGYIRDSNHNLILYKSCLVGGIGGITGQFFASPFSLIKTQLQTQAVQAIAVGHQHHHEGSWKALKDIYNQNGIRGLFRGAGASVPRAFIGSTSQLISFTYTKEYLNGFSNFKERPHTTVICSSMVGGIAISIMMTPFDLILIRLYNQPVNAIGKGLLYDSYFDCVVKIFKTEGVAAFYKGFGPMYLRLGPHTILCLVFWEEFDNLYRLYSG